MKNESTYAKKFTALLRRALSQPHEPSAARDAVTQLVIGFLEWNATRKQAEAAYARLLTVMVDNNDLRVSHPHEVVAIIGERYPHAGERCARMRECLQEVFRREHGVSLEVLAGKAKKQVRTYLDELPGMVSYVAAQTSLLCFDVHGMPVDDVLRENLVSEQVVDPEATCEQVAAFIERQLKAGEAVAAHHALRAWSDAYTPPPAQDGGKPARKAPKPAVKTTKKTTKKTTDKGGGHVSKKK